MSSGSRVVCVTDPLGPGGGAATLTACRLAVRALEERMGSGAVEVGVLGTAAAFERARECGLSPAWRIPVPCGSLRLAERPLTRLMQKNTPAAVVAWGERAAQLISRGAEELPLVVVMDAPFKSKLVRQAELAEVLCMGEALADQACSLGWLPIRIRSVLPPMPAWQPSPSRDRNSIRRIWNAAESDFVIGVLPTASGFGNSLFAFHAFGRFAIAGHGAHLVLDPATRYANEVRPFARRLGLDERVHFDDAIGCPWNLAPAVDLWMSLPDPKRDETALHPSGAAALGSPILATVGSLAAAAIEPSVDGIVSEAGINAFAFELIQAARNPARCSDMVTASRVKYAPQSVRDGFALAIQESVLRVCPEAFAMSEPAPRLPAATKFAAAST
ncbi:MAG: hypothetical protein K8R92_10525 [Planctomycetes bacterium]|nr:hypothetical protein [Planctomycetota bacterium]